MNTTPTLTFAGILCVSIFASLLNLGLCSKPWDLLLFSQNWPTSVCDSWMQGRGRSCTDYPKDIWTVHGIWPTKLGTVGPGFCGNSNPFDPHALSSIDGLDYYWAPIHIQGPRTSFWSHEWTKHGTCATSIYPLSNQVKYFSQAVQWAKQYNMIKVLGAAGITPGQEYTVQNINNAIKQVLHTNAQILCYVNRQRQSVLLEVRLCFNKNLELADCDGTVVSKGAHGLLTNCRSNWVLYPEAH